MSSLIVESDSQCLLSKKYLNGKDGMVKSKIQGKNSQISLKKLKIFFIERHQKSKKGRQW